MKKLLFVFAAIVAAVSAQAAYVDWQYSVSEAKSGGTDWTSGHTAYLLTADAWDGIKTSVTTDALEGAKLDKSSFYLAESGKSYKLYSTGAGGSAGVRQVEADTGNYYVILATTDGYSVALNNVAITAYDDGSGVGTGLTPGVTIAGKDNAASGAGISYTPMSSGGGGTGGIPEPTSGLLLLVGGAMLALRRRR